VGEGGEGRIQALGEHCSASWLYNYKVI
jgi:hypothetical protein